MKTTLIKLVALLTILPLAADADPIVISGAADPVNDGLWEIALLDDTFDELEAVLTNQVWWGNDSLAGLFAEAAGIGAGNAGFSPWGPLFAVSTLILNDLPINKGLTCMSASCDLVAYENASNAKLYTYATASRTAIPEPSTLGLLLIGIAGLLFAGRRVAG